MDREIQDGLEDYLHGLNARARSQVRPLMSQPDAGAAGTFEQRLGQASDQTRRDVEAFRETAGLLHSLQAPEEVPQPSGGFYARVLERIEAQRASNSFWSVFLNPQFSRRLVFASAALLMLLGVTLATTDGTNAGLFGTSAPELVEFRSFDMPEDFAVASASQPIEAGLVSHSEAAGHDQMLVELATFHQ